MDRNMGQAHEVAYVPRYQRRAEDEPLPRHLPNRQEGPPLAQPSEAGGEVWRQRVRNHAEDVCPAS